MQKILISTIVRQRIKTLPLWFDQIMGLIELNKSIDFSISVAENCSTDGSKEFLLDAIKKFSDAGVATYSLFEDLGTPYYGSIKSGPRTLLLAAQRNKTLNCPAFDTADKLCFVEPDIRYEPKEMSSLFSSKADLISARSTLPGIPLYDTWATRLDYSQEEWAGAVPTAKPLRVWSTFNCFAVARAEPFQEHLIRFDGVNPRTGKPDCDTVSVCEALHKHNCHEIYLHGGITVEHLG